MIFADQGEGDPKKGENRLNPLIIRNICIRNETVTFSRCKKFALKYFPMNEKDNWRINALKELKQVDAVEAFYEDEIKEMKEYIA